MLLKRVSDGVSAYVAVCLVWVALAAAEAFAVAGDLWLPAEAATLVLLSAAGLIAYYGGTLLAMRWGELSVHYPIIRSSPIAIVIISAGFLGQAYDSRTLSAIALIVIAGFFLQNQPGRPHAHKAATAAALVAMFGSAVYALADAEAMQQVEPAPFLFWVYILVSIGLAALGWVANGRGGHPLVGGVAAVGGGPARIVSAAVVSYLSYRFILAAFQLGGDPAAVTAIRQISIPVSILLAAIVLGEPRGLRKLVWGGLMAVGIAILASSA